MATINQLFKGYKNSGGTMNFKEFLASHDESKNINAQIKDMYTNSNGWGNFSNAMGVSPTFHSLRAFDAANKAKFRNATGDEKADAAANMTLGINNNVLVGAAIVIVGAVALNYYLKHKK